MLPQSRKRKAGVQNGVVHLQCYQQQHKMVSWPLHSDRETLLSSVGVSTHLGTASVPDYVFKDVHLTEIEVSSGKSANLFPDQDKNEIISPSRVKGGQVC